MYYLSELKVFLKNLDHSTYFCVWEIFLASIIRNSFLIKLEKKRVNDYIFMFVFFNFNKNHLVPLPTYILGPNKEEQVQHYPTSESDFEICHNVYYLGTLIDFEPPSHTTLFF